jgi:hypothetical protein
MHYCQEEFPPNNVQNIEVGDVLVVNDLDPRYKGEVQIALRSMKNDGTKNVAAKIPENEHILLEWLKSWTPFELLEVKCVSH